LVAEDSSSEASGGDERSKQEEERRREAVKLYYDHLKHLTTLAGATAVVELAIYRERLVGPGLVGLSLALLAFCVILCLFRIAEEQSTTSNPGRVLALPPS
jgi:hypothetical protein